MKKKVLRISALVLAVMMIIGVCFFANSLVGNPISKALAKNTAENYLEEKYGDKDYELEDVSYSFKDGYYYAHVSSPSSIDTSFSLLINGFGKLRYDYRQRRHAYPDRQNRWRRHHRRLRNRRRTRSDC